MAEREVPRVVFECAMHERKLNRFYGVLLARLATLRPSLRFATQLAAWDAIKTILSATRDRTTQQHEVCNLASSFALLVARRTLALTVLKLFDFTRPTNDTTTFLHAFTRTLLRALKPVAASDELHSIVAAGTKGKDGPYVRDGLVVFLRKFGIGTDKSDDHDRDALLVRVKAFTHALETMRLKADVDEDEEIWPEE
jgi:hypothetical protein